MSNNLQQYPGRVLIEEVVLQTDETTVDITNMVSEINIHSSMNLNSTFGEILVVDHINLFVKSKMIAGDIVSIKLSHNDVPSNYNFKIKAFENINNLESGRGYTIKLVSELEYNSYYRKVSKGFVGTTSEMAAIVFSDNTKDHFNIWEDSIGNQSIVIPNWSPIRTINWLAKRSRSATSASRFIFFQDSHMRYNFMSLPKLRELYSTAPVTYRYNSNTLGRDTGGGIIPDSAAEMTAILSLDYLNGYDIEKAMNRGVIQNTTIHTDFTTKTINIDQNNYWDTYSKNNLNKGNQWKYEQTAPGNIVIENFAANSGVLSGANKIIDETSSNYMMDRSQEVEIVVQGNNIVDIGQIVKLEIPVKEPENTTKKDDLDPRWSGNYYVTAKRDVITRKGHQMVLRCTKESQATEDYI